MRGCTPTKRLRWSPEQSLPAAHRLLPHGSPRPSLCASCLGSRGARAPPGGDLG